MTTRTIGRRRFFPERSVSSGSSARAVPSADHDRVVSMTQLMHTRPRNLSGNPARIARGGRDLPSKDTAIFKCTNGRPVRMK